MGYFDPYSEFNRKQRSGIFKKGGTAALQLQFNVKKKVIRKKKNFANFRKYEKDFRGAYNIYKLLKQC